jgi:hypothetical protein
METTTVNVHRVGERPVNQAEPTLAELEADLQKARRLARWLDAEYEVFGVKFGGDAIIGLLLPWVGDTLTALASTYLVYVARRHNLGKVVQTRMAFNIFVDWLPGLVPLVGDAIDVAYKANLKNLKLLEAAAEKKLRRARRG